MDEFTIHCPYCFQVVVIELEPDIRGRMVQDCEVCCRPWDLNVERDSEGQPMISVDRAQ